jgi:hypothetical protein
MSNKQLRADAKAAYQALKACGSNKEAARLLGLAESTLRGRYNTYLRLHPNAAPIDVSKNRAHTSSLEPALMQEALDAYATYGTENKAAAALGISRGTLHSRLATARAAQAEAKPMVQGRVKARSRQSWPIPKKKGDVFRYIFTSAQNNTYVHEGVWRSLTALAAYYGAEIHVSRFTYDLSSYGNRNVKPGRDKSSTADEIWYDPKLASHGLDESVEVAPGLIFCGEMNILPTAARPLSGFQAYTGRASGIFPHVKFAMEAIPNGKHEETKLNFTTGTVTQRNYIQKTAGLKAEFHHGYGGLLVEVDSDGAWFCRQLNADSEGVIYDLDLKAENGKVTSGHRVEAIVWGDIHVGRVSRETEKALWVDPASMGRVLRPKNQLMEDVLDFRARNHHEMKNFHKMLDKFYRGKDDVMEELRDVADFLANRSVLPDCQTVVVRSNHDAALDKWLRDANYKEDLKNAKFFLRAQLAMVEAIERDDKNFLAVEWALRDLGPVEAKFLRRDESFVLCPDAHGGIECGWHGDQGANGGRGSLTTFAKAGTKSITGDSHSPGIMDGAYRVGVTGDLDHGYNEGMSSWSNTHGVVYANGKRTLVTCRSNKWRAK